MTQRNASLVPLSDDQLLAEVKRLVACERRATAELIRSLMELDARRLYLAQGFSSLFTYCTQALHLSEHAALGRIEVARVARRLPAVLDCLLDGSVTVTNVRLLSPHLTEENHGDLLLAARHKSKREIEEIVARLRPRPDVVASVRKLPEDRVTSIAPPSLSSEASAATSRSAEGPAPIGNASVAFAVRRDDWSAPPIPIGTVPSSASRPVIVPLAPERYRVQFTVSRETRDGLRRAQELLRHAIPDGDPAAIFARAIALLVEQLEKAKCAATPRPRASAGTKPGSRHIPAAVRRVVWRRDEGRCAFVGSRGRCTARGSLEFHHVRPFAAGGEADASNIQLRCAAHNKYESDLFFGVDVVRERSPAWGSTRSGPSSAGSQNVGTLS